MKYKRIEPKDYHGAGFFRCYIQGKRYYPRILICIHETENNEIIISVDEKMNKNSWWSKAALPCELITELQEMLNDWAE